MTLLLHRHFLYHENGIRIPLEVTMCDQGSRKWDPLDPVGSVKTYLVRQNFISAHCRLDKLKQIGQAVQQIGQTVQQMVQTFLKIGQNIAQSVKTFFFLCLKSKSDVHGLLSHLEQMSNISAPSDYCALKEFWV